jgi:hypothetical protein
MNESPSLPMTRGTILNGTGMVQFEEPRPPWRFVHDALDVVAGQLMPHAASIQRQS